MARLRTSEESWDDDQWHMMQYPCGGSAIRAAEDEERFAADCREVSAVLERYRARARESAAAGLPLPPMPMWGEKRNSQRITRLLEQAAKNEVAPVAPDVDVLEAA